MSLKGFTVSSLMFILIVSMAGAQTQGGGNREMSVEESYLQESVDAVIIREQSRSDNREMKMIALEYVNDAINAGNVNDDIRSSLEYLAIDGTINQTRENGRLVNNFPDVRARAAEYLGKIKTTEAKNSLVKVLLVDPEPMVLTEAVRALGIIGLNDNDDAVNAITWIVTRFDVLKPDNLLALAAVDAFDSFAAKNNGQLQGSAVRLIMHIAESASYIKPVQERARQTLTNIRRYSTQSK